jgi:hypothetical protein
MAGREAGHFLFGADAPRDHGCVAHIGSRSDHVRITFGSPRVFGREYLVVLFHTSGLGAPA